VGIVESTIKECTKRTTIAEDVERELIGVMKMRLIDADELIEMIEGTEELLDFQKDECIVCINACDTAYSVEKVVERLEEKLSETKLGVAGEQFWTSAGIQAGYTDAIEIVRNGGLDNAN
jgi:hypothetical protein